MCKVVISEQYPKRNIYIHTHTHIHTHTPTHTHPISEEVIMLERYNNISVIWNHQRLRNFKEIFPDN